MFYVYVVQSNKNSTLYIRKTNDLKRRLKEHNSGHGGVYTKKNGPYTLIYYEAFLDSRDAAIQELFYKSGYGKEILKEKIKNSLYHKRV